MAIDTKGVPASVAALTTPPEEPKAGLTLTWKFANGQDYTVMVEEGSVTPFFDDAGSVLSWHLRTQDGREVTVYAAHLLVFESRQIVIKPRKVGTSG